MGLADVLGKKKIKTGMKIPNFIKCQNLAIFENA